MAEAKEPSKTTILLPSSAFKFVCEPGIPCYTSCCGDVNIFLTPYDVLRLRKRLNLTSGEFLGTFTTKLSGTNAIIPLVVLKMGKDPAKRCPFVTETGCTVYEDRPWACRMFPIDMETKGKYSLIVGEERCKGLCRNEVNTVADWLEKQGVPEYDLMNELYEQITSDIRLNRLDVTNSQIKSMVFMATYDLDTFRRFVFESRFLQLFDLEEERVRKVGEDDLELLLLGFDWIKFGLFGEKSLQPKHNVQSSAQTPAPKGPPTK
jgi:hypothetical protein